MKRVASSLMMEVMDWTAKHDEMHAAAATSETQKQWKGEKKRVKGGSSHKNLYGMTCHTTNDDLAEVILDDAALLLEDRCSVCYTTESPDCRDRTCE